MTRYGQKVREQPPLAYKRAAGPGHVFQLKKPMKMGRFTISPVNSDRSFRHLVYIWRRMQDLYITQRLTIERIAVNEGDFIARLVNTPGWLKYIGERNVKSGEDGQAYIQRIVASPHVRYWVVYLKDPRVPAGVVTLIKRDYLEHWDIGFAFLPEHNGKGYARESAECILDELFAGDEHHVIQAVTVPHNAGSIRLLERMGFQFDKEIEHEKEKLSLYALSNDKHGIDRLTHSFYALFTNTRSEVPAIEKIYSLCVPSASIVKRMHGSEEKYTLDSFVAPRKRILTDGTLTNFEEWETAEETIIINDLASRHSRYRKTGSLEGREFTTEGTKQFQYKRTSEGWKISSVVWEDDI